MNVNATYRPPNPIQAFEAGRMAYLRGLSDDVHNELGPYPNLERAFHRGWERERDDFLEYIAIV